MARSLKESNSELFGGTSMRTMSLCVEELSDTSAYQGCCPFYWRQSEITGLPLAWNTLPGVRAGFQCYGQMKLHMCEKDKVPKSHGGVEATGLVFSNCLLCRPGAMADSWQILYICTQFHLRKHHPFSTVSMQLEGVGDCILLMNTVRPLFLYGSPNLHSTARYRATSQLGTWKVPWPC